MAYRGVILINRDDAGDIDGHDAQAAGNSEIVAGQDLSIDTRSESNAETSDDRRCLSRSLLPEFRSQSRRREGTVNITRNVKSVVTLVPT